MQDFNSFAKNNKQSKPNSPNGEKAHNQQNLMNLVMSLASKYDGKNSSELIKAVYEEAKKGKANGTLTNKDLDNFANMLSPLLDDKKRKLLYKITEELKRI